MSFDSTRIDLLIQYALLVAGEQDELFDRQLGPIHLLKYVYLGDLAHAQRNEGATFTGADWQFYHFGPWASSVHARIEPALHAIGAAQRSFESDYDDKEDWHRWALRDDRLLEDTERRLPPSVAMQIRRAVRDYGKDTPRLLDHVYRTAPMLEAAPNERLDFSVAVKPKAAPEQPAPPALRADSLSAKKQKVLAERMQALRQAAKSRPTRKSKLINPVRNPRHDEVYAAGIAWLDEIAGAPLTSGDHVAEFDAEVWKSQTRKGNDVS